jgi:uncharacterized protein
MKKNNDAFQPPCAHCGGKCCQYTAIEIDRPTTKREYDNIRWYLSHVNVHIFIDHDRKWHVEFRSHCENLGADNSCGMYVDRPDICRNHGNLEQECEYYDSPYLHYFSTRIEFEGYLKKKKVNWKFRKHEQ